MVVENVSNISGEMAFDALYASAKRNNNKKYLYSAIICALGAGVLVYGLLSSQSMWVTAGGIFTAFGIGLVLYTIVILFKLPRDIRKDNKEIMEHGVTYTYKFREQGVDLMVNINGKKSKGTYSYLDFRKVYDYDERFELRLKDGECLFVLKNGFTNERMIEFFKKNVTLNKKLKIVKKEEKNPEKLGNQ